MIGDEIMKGQVQDTNSHFIARHLFLWGVQVKKVGSCKTFYAAGLIDWGHFVLVYQLPFLSVLTSVAVF